MSSDWASLTVGDLVLQGEATIQTGPFGSQLHSHDYVAVGTPVIPTEAIGRGRILDIDVPKVGSSKAAELWRHRLRRGDILFARRGAQATGLSAIVDERYEDALCGTGALLLRTQSPRVDPDYLAMFLSSDSSYRWLRAHAVGAVMPNLNTDIIKALPLVLPSIEEQREVAEFFGALDDRIALLRETNATLEAIAQALFKSWFVDFDPVRATQQGLAPAGMDEATAALFPDSFEESALGLVPKGWPAGTLDDLSDLNSRSWSGRHHPERVRYLDLANVKDNEVATVTEFAFDEAPSRARRVLRSGDTIVGTVRPGNRSFAFIHEPVPDLTASTGFAVLSPKVADNTAFVYLAATQDASIEHLSHVADGGAYPAVRPDVVSALACVVPSAEILRAFNAVACPLLVKVSANQRQAQTLATLRDTLLPRLISGQLRLPEVEAIA